MFVYLYRSVNLKLYLCMCGRIVCTLLSLKCVRCSIIHDRIIKLQQDFCGSKQLKKKMFLLMTHLRTGRFVLMTSETALFYPMVLAL